MSFVRCFTAVSFPVNYTVPSCWYICLTHYDPQTKGMSPAVRRNCGEKANQKNKTKTEKHRKGTWGKSINVRADGKTRQTPSELLLPNQLTKAFKLWNTIAQADHLWFASLLCNRSNVSLFLNMFHENIPFSLL